MATSRIIRCSSSVMVIVRPYATRSWMEMKRLCDYKRRKLPVIEALHAPKNPGAWSELGFQSAVVRMACAILRAGFALRYLVPRLISRWRLFYTLVLSVYSRAESIGTASFRVSCNGFLQSWLMLYEQRHWHKASVRFNLSFSASQIQGVSHSSFQDRISAPCVSDNFWAHC